MLLRSRRRALIVLVLLGATGCGALLLLHRLGVVNYGALWPPTRPPKTHPFLPADPTPAYLTTRTPTREELRAPAAGTNLVICVLDAARVDHIGCYGYPRETTPNIDRLAADSVVFEQHFCQYPDTVPSTASLLTSLYPDTHLTTAGGSLPRSVFTLAKSLESDGFHTAFFSSNYRGSGLTGIGTDFELTRAFGPSRDGRGRGRQAGLPDDAPESRPAQLKVRSPEGLLTLIADWLKQDAAEPFLAYIHFLPPHLPYNAPDEMKRVFAGKHPPNFWRGGYPFRGIEPRKVTSEHASPGPRLVNLYDANLLWADWAVGELERLLRDAGVLDNTVLIVTADHGETFGEHGYRWHPDCPYDEAIRIPLLVSFPGEARPVGRVRALTQTIDLLPTILDLYQLPYPEDQVQGRSLLPLLTGEVEKVNDYIFCRTGGRPPAYVVHDLRFALLLYQGGKLRALYDLETDPWQTRNVIEEQPERAAELIEAFREFAMAQRRPPLNFLDPDAKIEALPSDSEVELSDEARRELEAIGYLE